VAAAALLFSTGGAAVKATTLTGWQTAGFRSLIAATALVLLIPEARKGWSRRIVLPAMTYAATLVLFVLANKLTTSASAIFLQSTAPAYLLLLGPLVLKEPLRRKDLWFGAVLAAGIAMFFQSGDPGTATAPDPIRGNLLATLSGASWACTLVALRWLAHAQKESGALATVTLGNLFAFLVCAPMAFPVSWSVPDAAAILYLGVIQIGLGYVCLTRGVRSVPAFEASILLMVEPVMNPVWTWLLHSERPGAWATAGCLIVLAATLTHLIWAARASAAPRES
jgi:drug/metabolite transporter (DMT)-like permease